jgi:hypothetical protein
VGISRYLYRDHSDSCDCSVCYVRRELSKSPLVTPERCSECKPAVISKNEGRFVIERPYYCEKHRRFPLSRPERWWFKIYDSGKPTPFLPLGIMQDDI